MENNIRNSFEKICAEEDLKEKTAIFLETEIRKRNKAGRAFQVKRVVVIYSSIILLILFGRFSYSLYFTESSFIDIDVNPSIELTVNRFDRVISSQAYNNEGLDLLDNTEIKHKDYNEAIEILLITMEKNGYFKQDSFLSITVQTNNGTKENSMLTNINTRVATSIQEYSYNPEVNIFSVTEEVRNHAHDNNISPAKYLFIAELQETDPTVTIESCRDHSLTEIKQLIQSNNNSHHSNITNEDHRSENGHHR